MATVCVGPELQPGPDGRLRLRVCGAPAEQAWPYPCPPGAANPVRVDPECGVWVPPAAQVGTAFASGATATVDQAVPADFVVVETAAVSVTNPSDCYPAKVFPFIEADVFFDLWPGSDATAACRVAENEFFQLTNPAPTGGTVMNGNHSQSTILLLSAADVPPGGTQSYSWPIEVGQGVGQARWRLVNWSIRALVLAGPS